MVIKIALGVLTAVMSALGCIGLASALTGKRDPTEIAVRVTVVVVCAASSVALFWMAFRPPSGVGFWSRPLGPTPGLTRLLEGTRSPEGRLPSDVVVVYHTYAGVLVHGVQSEWRFAAPPEQARRILRRMLRTNLTWGLLVPHLVVVPFLALGNYWAQMRSIRRQEKRLDGHDW